MESSYRARPPPARVAVTARCNPVMPLASASVAPVVSTSSMSTALATTGATRRKCGTVRASRRRPAWRGHQTPGRSAGETATPVMAETSRASMTAGSQPYRIRRTAARGTGTSAAASDGSTFAIGPARSSAAAPSPWYLRRWTRRRAAVSWARPLQTLMPDDRREAVPGRRRAPQSSHRYRVPTREQQRQRRMCRSYQSGPTHPWLVAD